MLRGAEYLQVRIANIAQMLEAFLPGEFVLIRHRGLPS